MNKNVAFLFISLLAAWWLLVGSAKADETYPARIISGILDTQRSIIAGAGNGSSDHFVFLAFWDFDGTILRGDCSEGLRDAGRQIYPGLAQLAIEAGYSQIYSRRGGVDRFWRDYRHMERNIGKWLAHPFIPQMLRGTQARDIQALSARHFSTVLYKYYFKSSVRILKALEDSQIKNYVLSASADVFLDGASETLELPLERFSGIEVKIESGRLTEELVYPVTRSTGKTRKLVAIVEDTKRRHPDKQVVALAAFGDSYDNDGPFMKYVANQTLPNGKPLAVMINGSDAPAEYRGLFTRLRQSETFESAGR